jgi:hypothetical protein
MAEELVRLLLMIDLGHQHSLVVIALVSHQVSNVDDPLASKHAVTPRIWQNN